MSDPQKYTLHEQKVRKFYGNLIESGKLTSEDLGLEDEFVQKINGDPDKLIKLRSNIIGAGLLSEEDMGGNEAMFSQPFLKKKDVPLISSKDSSISPEKPSEPKLIEPTEEVDKSDFSFYDYHNQTTNEGGSAHIASSYKNKSLADHRNDEAVRVVDKQIEQDMHDVSNVIAEDRKSLNLNMDEKEMKRHMDDVEDRLETQFNSKDRKSTTIRIRQQMAEGYKDHFVDDLDSNLKASGLSYYDALTDPAAIEKWRDQYKRKVPGEILDAAIGEFESEFNSVVIENENQNYIQPKIQEYKDRGYSDDEALELVMNEYSVQQRKHFEANMDGSTIKRYELQNQIDQLSREKPDGWEETVYNIQMQLDEMGPTLYDEQGRRTIMPEVEERELYELEVNAAIDEISEEIPSFKENLDQLYDEEFMVMKNLERQLEAIDTAQFDAPVAQPGMGAGGGTVIVPEQRKRYQHLKSLYGEQKIRVDALGRMKFANENIGLTNKGEDNGYYGQIYTDAIRTANHKLFMPKTTKAEEVAEYGEIMYDLGEVLSEEEMKNIAPDMKDMLAESAGYMTDFVGKLLVAEATLGATGVTSAITSLSKVRKIHQLRKVVKAKGAKRFALKATAQLEQSVIKAGMNEVKFQAAGAETGHGVAFHYADKAIGRAVPILMKRGNKYLALVANSLARNPFTMTASMEAVSAGSGALHALANDKLVSEEMNAMFGDMDETMKRVAVELMVGSMFGFGEVVKASHRGLFITTPEYVLKLQMKALKNGRPDVAAELGNIKFKLTEADYATSEATKTQKKAKYLTENGIDAKELYSSKKNIKGKGNRLNVKKVNEEFDAMVAEEVFIYDKVLGEGSLEAMRAKAKILKKVGVDIEGHSPGNIEVIYESHRNKPKVGPKIRKQTELHEISSRKKTAKKIAKKLKEENIGEGMSESTDADMEIRQDKQIVRSEQEREFMKSYRRTRRDTSRNRLDQWKEKYKRSVQGEWKGGEAETLTNQMLKTVGDSLGLLKAAGIKKGKHYNKLKSAERILKNSLKGETAMSNTQADIITNHITDSQVAFTATAMRGEINNLIAKPTKKTTDRLDPQGLDSKTSFLMKAIDRMFNKAKAKEDYITGSEKEATDAMKRLDEFKQTESQVEKMLSAKEKDAVLHEGKDFTIYEGVNDAMKSGATYENALARRAELRVEAEGRTLTEREMIEYEVLGFADGSKMSTYQLMEANRALKSLLNNGKTEFKVKQEHEQLRARFERYAAVKAIDPKSVDVSKKLVTPNLTGLNLLQRSTKQARSWTESLPTMMEWLQSRTPGRRAYEGELHGYTDRALKAGNDKAAEIGYFVKEMIDIEGQIFGNAKKAEAKFKEWRKDHTFEVIREVEGVETTTLETMSIQDALTIRAYGKQADQAVTFDNRGWTQDGFRHFENQIVEIGGKEAIAWADAVVNGIMPRIWSRVNGRYKQDIGADLTVIENYFPVARKFDSKTGTGDPFTLTNTPLENVRSTHTSSSKERSPDVANWYKLNKSNDLAFNDMLYKHLDHSMQYVHYQQLVKDMDAVFRNEDVQAVIEDGFTANTNKFIDAMINDLGRGRIGAERFRSIDKIRTNFVRSKLGLNMTLLPKQLMSINMYQAELSPAEAVQFGKYLLAPSVKTMKHLGRSRDIRLRYEKSQWDRDLALVEHGLKTAAGQSEGKVQLSRGEGLGKFTMTNMKDNMLIMTKYGDYGAIVMGGQAMYRVRYDTYTRKGFTPAEASQKAYNDFVSATRRTQQSGAVEDLSHAQKGTVGKLITQFKNSPLQYLRGEHAAVTNMFEGFKQGDKVKFQNGLKNFILYHFVAPQLFHAASNGFYLGEKDKSWLDDPMTLVTALGGSLMYMPIMGSALQHIIQNQVTGQSFGTDTGIAADILEEATDAIDLAAEIINKAGDPGEFSISADDIWAFANSAGAFAGVPVKAPESLYKGWKGYLQHETDDELALLGYSPYMRGDYSRSRNYPVIHKHLPENGGTMGTMREEYAEEHGEAATQRAWPYLQKEYLMYNKFGGNDRHVNYIYMNLKTSDDKAKYIYDLYKNQVKGQRPLRKNVSIKDIVTDMETNDVDFTRMVAEWQAYGVIDKSSFTKFLIMVRDQYTEVYEY